MEGPTWRGGKTPHPHLRQVQVRWQGQHLGIRHPEAGCLGAGAVRTKLWSGAKENLRGSRAPQAAAWPDTSSEQTCAPAEGGVRTNAGNLLGPSCGWKAGPSAGDRVLRPIWPMGFTWEQPPGRAQPRTLSAGPTPSPASNVGVLCQWFPSQRGVVRLPGPVSSHIRCAP